MWVELAETCDQYEFSVTAVLSATTVFVNDQHFYDLTDTN